MPHSACWVALEVLQPETPGWGLWAWWMPGAGGATGLTGAAGAENGEGATGCDGEWATGCAGAVGAPGTTVLGDVGACCAILPGTKPRKNPKTIPTMSCSVRFLLCVSVRMSSPFSFGAVTWV